ncbi:MAG: sigma-70 family RNA polymerase sigma factor [Armatimonadetes bacterium]|nr:sigma-70 family RNA polymerase sigma factor [Armatimonadota bacterium]
MTWSARETEEVYHRLENRLGRSTSEEEVAKEMGITQDQLRSHLSQMAGTAIVSLEEMLAQDDGDLTRKDSVLDPGIGPEEEVSRKELKDALKDAIANLPPREKLLVSLYYFEELTLKEITKVLQVSEARASQLHAQAVFRIRGRLHGFLPPGKAAEPARHHRKATGAV